MPALFRKCHTMREKGQCTSREMCYQLNTTHKCDKDVKYKKINNFKILGVKYFSFLFFYQIGVAWIFLCLTHEKLNFWLAEYSSMPSLPLCDHFFAWNHLYKSDRGQTITTQSYQNKKNKCTPWSAIKRSKAVDHLYWPLLLLCRRMSICEILAFSLATNIEYAMVNIECHRGKWWTWIEMVILIALIPSTFWKGK